MGIARFCFFRKPYTFLGHGWELERPEKIVPIVLPDEDRKGHLFCFGTTRIGKTRLIELMIEQDIRKGYSVVLLDPKGDIDLFSKVVEIAFKEKRQEELILITPIFPNVSAKIDPLSHYYMPEEIVSHVVAGIKAREEFFINIAYETTLVVVLALILFAKVRGVKPFFNFQEIKRRVSYEDLEALKEALSSLRYGEYEEEVKDVLETLIQVLNSPKDYFSKVSSSLRTVLTALSTGNVGKIIGKADSNEFIHRLEKGKRVILVVQTGSLLTRRTATIVARVLLSMIQSFVGRRYASGKKINPPLCLYMDEASNLFYLGVEDLFNKAGGAGVWLHGFTQSLADIEAEIGYECARKILDNTNSKIFMRVNDPKTAQYVASYSGKKKKFSPILSLGGGMTIREVEEEIVRADDVLTLKCREFYFFTFSGAYRGKIASVKKSILDVIYPETGCA